MDTKKNNTSLSSTPQLSRESIRQLLSSITDARDRLIFRMLYETGCTPAELVSIKISDIGGNRVKIRCRETGKIRFSRISGRLAKEISLYIKGNSLAKEAFLLSTRQSSRISEKRVRQLVQHYTLNSGYGKINPLSLRYVHIAHAYLNGVFIENIAEQLGLTTFRVFQILREMKVSPKPRYYSRFLRGVA